MKTLYLDIFSGISGDMFIGAMIDLGVPFDAIERELEKLDLDEWHAHASRKHKSSIEGVKFDVHCHEHGHEDHHHDEHEHGDHREADHNHGQGGHKHSHRQGDHEHHHDHGHSHAEEHAHEHSHAHGRNFSEIRGLIQSSSLSPWVKEKAVNVFERIARAEGKIHGQPLDQVHFHEVGAVDSIIDIVGGCVALELLGKPRVLASTVTEGYGFITCAHGQFPIPAPATIAILAERKISIIQCSEPHELVTPTGAALLAEFVEEFGPLRNFAPEKIGYGLGERDNHTRPNVLRALLGSSSGAQESNHDWEVDRIVVIETNLDDINAELLGYVVERAFAAGALDVFHTAIQMKKNRPGVLLTVLCEEKDEAAFTELLLRETTALGVRRSFVERRKLKREFQSVETVYGTVEVKIGKLNDRVIQASPEFESCKVIADKNNIPLKWVYQAAMSALKDRME